MRFGRGAGQSVTTVTLALEMMTLCTGAAAGQSTQDASIVDEVTDQDKGVLPGATVTAMGPAPSFHSLSWWPARPLRIHT